MLSLDLQSRSIKHSSATGLTERLQVQPNHHVPLNAVLLTLFIGSCISIVPLGSATAFFSIQTIGNAGLLTSYIICIWARFYNRNWGTMYGNLHKPPPFYLGKTGGNIINLIAIASLIVFLAATCFPSAPNPTSDTFNWASVALVGTIIVAGLAYIRLHKDYLRQPTPPLFSEADEPVDVYVDNEKNTSTY